ncbi:MAG: bifunctional phosphopantothenoylcysteine decarboxylase/phosphopantothenate--cysteine ligase CoaBC [Desulfobacteraceae bacterium]
MKGKRVTVGVTGGIAAYKAAEIVRGLVKEGAEVSVAMTRNAGRFVGPLTFEALSGRRVITGMFDPGTGPMDHIRWGQETDLVLVAPATANFLAKAARGLADDFLSTMAVAATAPILLCPAMNVHMYRNSSVRENIRILKERGINVMEPGAGGLACGSEGPGRLPEVEDILERARWLLSPGDLTGCRIMVTAGATMEAIDPVRFITNRSSGKMGYALARAARRRGADVVLISGPGALKAPLGVTCIPIRSAEDMRRAVLAEWRSCDAVIKAAAVSDYRPKDPAGQKIKKEGRETQVLELVRTPDILAELGRVRGAARCVLVGFAAETESLINHAGEKLHKKNADMIVANDVSREDAGFETDTNLVKILHRDGMVEEMPIMSKEEVADCILDRVRDLWRARQGGGGS